MSKRTNGSVLSPELEQLMKEVGNNIRIARLRRKLTVAQICETTGLSSQTIWRVEQGSATVSIGIYLTILHVFHLEKDLLLIAADDKLGYALMDESLQSKKKKFKQSVNIARLVPLVAHRWYRYRTLTDFSVAHRWYRTLHHLGGCMSSTVCSALMVPPVALLWYRSRI